jgi:hypothetical protein
MVALISLGTDVAQEVKNTALEMGMTPKRLYSLAITEFVKSHKISMANGQTDSVYRRNQNSLPNDIIQAQYDMLDEEDW